MMSDLCGMTRISMVPLGVLYGHVEIAHEFRVGASTMVTSIMINHFMLVVGKAWNSNGIHVLFLIN